MKKQFCIITLLFMLFGTLLTDTYFNNVSAQQTDNSSDDNQTNDDNDTDNETVKRLKALFENAQDNFSCVSPKDIIKFPVGTNLERCVRQNMNENRWPIDCEKAAKLKSLTCDDQYISSLEGLQQFVNLETIIFERNGTYIDNLSAIRNLQNMLVLSVPNSFIVEIGYLAKLKKLRTLDLSGNMITNLEFLPFISSLQTLALEYQAPDYIRDITHIAPLTMLTTLSLQGNKITDISPLASLKRLSILSIRDNRVSSLEPLRELTNLTALNFSINMISDISPLDNLTRLQGIAGNHNKITNIDAIDNMTNLRQFSFIQNSINNVSALAEKRKLRSIALDYNKIEDVTPIKDIMYYAELGELGLAYNCVPRENYRQIRYLDTIKTLRLDNQCEPFPTDVPDNSTIVNGDLVGSKDVLDKDNITITRFQQTAGRGCSAGGSESRADYLLIFSAFAALICAIWRNIYKKN